MQTVTETTERAAKYLLFRLGTETFGVDVMRVREIVGMQTVTVVTRAAGGVKGLINLRGKIVPVIDRRTDGTVTAKSSLIVMRDGTLTVAMVVDEVMEITGTADGMRVLDAGEIR